MSDSIWCLKYSPSFFSKSDLLPFFDDVEEEEEGEEDDDDEDEEEASLPELEYSSESNHMCAKTWQIPSSTSGLKFG